MSDRFALIARKQEVQRQIEQLRRQLERVQGATANQRQRNQLETRLEQLMATEYNLRLAIDQAK
jgi:hypothetical protein